MKDLVLHDVTGYIYQEPFKTSEKLYTTTVSKDKYFITKNNEDISVFTKLAADDSISRYEIGKGEEFLDTIAYLIYEEQFVLVTTTQVIFLDKALKTKMVYQFNEKILAAKVYAPEYFIAVVMKDSISVFAIKENEGKLELISSSPHTDKAEESMYVGWGSENTQFQGPAAPKLRISSTPKYVCDDKKPFISWKENGDMFAVNMHDGTKRVVKVYDNNCKLINVSTFNGLEPLVDFRPSGNLLLTITSETGNDQILTLIEKNGEIRSQTKLDDDFKVIDLKWSLCGDAVALIRKDNIKDQIYLDIYLESNCKWNCKQRLQFCTKTWCSFEWAFSANNFFAITAYTMTGIYEYVFASKIVKCNKADNSYGLIGTTVGKRAIFHYYTDGVGAYEKFASTYELAMENQISYMAFDPNNYVVAIIDCNYNAKLFDYEEPTDWNLLREFQLFDLNESIPLCYRTIAIRNKLDVLAVQYSMNSSLGDKLYSYHVQPDGELDVDIELIENGVFSIIHPVNVPYDEDNDVYMRHHEETFPIIDAFALQIGSKIVKINLSTTGALSIEGTYVKAYVTSMFYNANYLVLSVCRETDADDQNNELPESDYIISLHLTAENINRLIHQEDPFNMAYNRSIEQGALLINLVHNSANLLLLLPRGNVETIEIRNIAVEILAELIKYSKYEMAFNFIHFHGMDLHLLVDLDPLKFIENADYVYRQLERYDILPKIAMDLRDSVIEYKEGNYVYKFPRIENKTDRVCDALISSYCSQTYMNMDAIAVTLLSLYSSYPVLNLAKAIHFLSSYAYNTDISFVEAPIKVLAAYVPYMEIFKSALSVYSIDVAECVVNISQMDPKIYRPFIEKLRRCDSNLRRFNICNFLENYKLATVYSGQIYESSKTAKSANFFFKYVKAHRTYRTAYQNVDLRDPLADQIAELFANDLELAKNYAEAAMVLFRHKHYIRASELYAKALHFDEALVSINMSDLNQDEKKIKVKQVTDDMVLAGQFREAAHIYLNQLDDIDTAVVCLLENHDYIIVFNLAHKHNMVSIIESDLKPHLLNYLERTIEKLSEDRLAFEKFLLRLAEIREKCSIDVVISNDVVIDPDQLELLNYDGLDVDLYSDRGSVTTTKTTPSNRSRSSSTASSRQRRKEALRITSLRVGGEYEDIAIMAKLHSMVVEVFSMQHDVKKLFSSLFNIIPTRKDYFIQELHGRFIDFENRMIERAETIWPKCFTNLNEHEIARRICYNLHLLAPHQRFPPPMKIEWESSLAKESVNDPFF